MVVTPLTLALQSDNSSVELCSWIGAPGQVSSYQQTGIYHCWFFCLKQYVSGRVVLQELMRQASWNLCPHDIQYNTACYADPDVTFSSIAGSSSTPMPDLPDGDWELVLKKDIFQKVNLAAEFLLGCY